MYFHKVLQSPTNAIIKCYCWVYFLFMNCETPFSLKNVCVLRKILTPQTARTIFSISDSLEMFLQIFYSTYRVREQFCSNS